MMDKKITPKKFSWLKAGVIALVVVSCAVFVYGLVSKGSTRSFKVSEDRLTIREVSRQPFEDFIPARAQVVPLKTVILDAIEGGRVEQVFVEEGEFVVKDQPLVELSNTTLQLEVIAREAEVTEQVNNLRDTRLSLEQNRLQLKKDIVEVDYAIQRLHRLVERRGELYEKRLIAKSSYDEVVDEYEYNLSLREITKETQEHEDKLRVSQVESLEMSVGRMQANLKIANKKLEGLTIKAPMDGLLSAFDAEVGESKSGGERIGQIDNETEFKLTSKIDEFYISRMEVGLPAEVTLQGTLYSLVVKKIYPEVEAGQFEIDLAFSGELPPNIRRGQTLQLRLILGDSKEAVVLARGGFYQDTGGSWAFVLDQEKKIATRREIKIGRRNSEYFEILDGLSPGESVVISEYTAFSEMDQLIIN